MSNSILKDIKPNEIPKICRVCLSKEKTINILKAQYENIPIRNIFQITLHEPINSEDKAISLCDQCLGLLLSFYQFMIKYKKNKSILSALANKTNPDHDYVSREIELVEIKQESPSDCEETNDQSKEINVSIKNQNNDSMQSTSYSSTEFVDCKDKKNYQESKTDSENVKKASEENESEEKTYFCNLCKINIETFEKVLEHFKEKCHRLARKCMLCDLAHRDIHTHLFTHRPKRMRIVCAPCHMSFETELDLAKHKKETNHMRKDCHLCGKSIRRACFYAHLSQHKFGGHKPNQIVCEICGNVYSNKVTWKNHYISKHKGQRLYCDKCPASYSTVAGLKMHSSIKHCGSSSTDDKADKYRFVRCEHCGKKMYKYHRKTVALHIAKHKGHNFICQVDDCMQTFPDKESRLQHSNSDHQRFDCDECKKSFFDANYFRTHTSSHVWKKNLSNPNVPKCWICQAEFATFKLLAAHLKSKYGLYICCENYCHKIFLRRINLNKHNSKFHCSKRQNANKNRFLGMTSLTSVCHVCNDRFGSDEQLQAHLRTHTQEYEDNEYAEEFTNLVRFKF